MDGKWVAKQVDRLAAKQMGTRWINKYTGRQLGEWEVGWVSW